MEIYNGTYCVYVHTNKINGKKYVGQTVCGHAPNIRWKNGVGYYTQKYFYRSIQKYGWDGFYHEVVANNLTKEEADNFEKLLIKELNTTNNEFGYNITLGGEGMLGVRLTKEQIEKQKKTMRKHYEDECFIKKMRDVAPKRTVHQFTLSGEFIKTFESAMEAQRETGIHNGGISKCAFGKTAHIKDYIFVFDEEINMINERVERYNNTKKLRIEPIVQLTLDGMFVKEWKNSADAGRGLGISYKNINAVCRKIRNKAGGFIWMYKSDYIAFCKTDCKSEK